jgi:hypothetical protein
MSLIRFRCWRSVGAASLLIVLLAVVERTWLRPQGRRFADVRELKTWAEARGLFCRSDRRDGEVREGLAVSTHAMTWEQAGGLCRATPGEGPDWKGVVWAINLYSKLGVKTGPPWNGECRVWGSIIVTGDRSLLDQLEEATD